MRDSASVETPGVAARAVSPALAIAGILLIATNLRMPMTSASPLLPRIKEDVGPVSYTHLTLPTKLL